MLFLSLLWGCIGLELADTSPSAGLAPIVEPDPIYWEACSYQMGDHICDFTHANAADTTTNLYDHYGKIIVIDYFTEWCPYCREASEKQEFYDSEDIVVMSIMLENQWGQEPRLEDAERWASAYELDPEYILRAGRYIVDRNGEWGPDIQAFPSFIIVDEDMIVREKIMGWSLELLQRTIADIENGQ